MTVEKQLSNFSTILLEDNNIYDNFAYSFTAFSVKKMEIKL